MDKIIIISSAQHRYLEEPFTLSTATDFSLGENLSGSFNPDPIQSDPTTEDPPAWIRRQPWQGKGSKEEPQDFGKIRRSLHFGRGQSEGCSGIRLYPNFTKTLEEEEQQTRGN